MTRQKKSHYLLIMWLHQGATVPHTSNQKQKEKKEDDEGR